MLFKRDDNGIYLAFQIILLLYAGVKVYTE